jgi:hypothetical protein
MSDAERMLDGSKKPAAADVSAWIGERGSARWKQLTDFIACNYPGVFEPQWLFGGKKHGWYLRFKKSKAFCSLIPERGRFKALLVFGAEERRKVEPILPELISHVREDYAAAATYHDGKWMATVVDNAKVIADIERLLALKRPPRAAGARKVVRRADARRQAQA